MLSVTSFSLLGRWENALDSLHLAWLSVVAGSPVKISLGKINVKTPPYGTLNTIETGAPFPTAILLLLLAIGRKKDREEAMTRAYLWMQVGHSASFGILLKFFNPFWRQNRVLFCVGVGERGTAVWSFDFLKAQEVMSFSASEAATISLAFLSGFAATLGLRMVLRLLRRKSVQIRYGSTGRHCSKKNLPVLYSLVCMIILATVLLSLLEGRRRKVCQTFSRSKLQHGILLTCVQFSFENSRLSRAGSFSNTAALFTAAGQQLLLLPCLYCLWDFVYVHVFYSIFPSGDFCFLLNGAV